MDYEIVCPECGKILRTAMTLQDNQIHPNHNEEELTFECPVCNEKLVMIITVAKQKGYYQE